MNTEELKIITIRLVVSKLASMTHGNQLGQELSTLLQTKDYLYHSWDNESCRASIKAEILNKVRELLTSKESK